MTFYNIVSLFDYYIVITKIVNDVLVIAHTAILVLLLRITWVEDLLFHLALSYLFKSQSISRWPYSSLNTYTKRNCVFDAGFSLVPFLKIIKSWNNNL